MICDIGAEERRRELRQAAIKKLAKARHCKLPRVILSVLRKTRHQRVPIIHHRPRRNAGASLRTRRFPVHSHGIVLEQRVGLQTLRRNAQNSARSRAPVHAPVHLCITLGLTMPCTFHLRTRRPCFAHRVVLND